MRLTKCKAEHPATRNGPLWGRRLKCAGLRRAAGLLRRADRPRRDGARAGSAGPVPQRRVEVVAPAIPCPGARPGAGVISPHAQLGEEQAARHRHRRRPDRPGRQAGAELAERVAAPAPRAAVGGLGAGVVPPGAHPPDAQPARDRARPEAQVGPPVPELALVAAAPAPGAESVVTAQLCSFPASTCRNRCPPATFTGLVRRMAVVLSPSWPRLLRPQQYARSVVVTAHV